jgi:hypothetical protein
MDLWMLFAYVVRVNHSVKNGIDLQDLVVADPNLLSLGSGTKPN